MQITVFSFLASLAWSSLLVAFIFLCRKKRFFIRRFGLTSLFLLCLVCIARMAIPLEYPFTKNLLIREGIINFLYEKMQLDKIGTSGMSILSIVLIVWAVVVVVLLVRFARQYRMAVDEVLSYPVWKDRQCRKVFGQVVSDSKKQMEISIRRSGEVTIPAGMGIFRKSIILPDEDYTDQELYYILLHEYTHFLNRDLLVKMLVHIFCCVFFWNPVVFLLRKNLDQVLEMKCDLCVTRQMNREEKAGYLTTIVSVIKKAGAKKADVYGMAALVSRNIESEVVERFQIVSGDYELRGRNRVQTIVCFLAFLVIFMFSYSFVVKPGYDPPIEEIETGPNVYEMRPDNTYLIKDKKGTYTIVMPDGCLDIVGEEFALQMEKDGFLIIREEEEFYNDEKN